MQKSEIDIIIIGAGLTGLTLAYYLRESGMSVKLIEARDRVGGRIQTSYNEGKASIELGATWLGQQHKQLITLLDELGLETFEQRLGETAIYEPISTSPFQIAKLPPNNNPSYRIKGGTQQIIAALQKYISTDQIIHDQVISIRDYKDYVVVKTNLQEIKADVVVSTLPPYLFQSTIDVNPSLPAELVEIMSLTHTWMADSIKIGLRYEQPFWRDNSLSGTIVSNVGPIPEMYDHSNFEDSVFALKGFFNGSYFSITKEERLAKVLNQLEKYYGAIVYDYIDYEEKVWAKDQYTSISYLNHVFPHQNNGHEIFNEPVLNSRLFIGGSETSKVYPGYMEGAVSSARHIYKKLSHRFKF